MATDYDLGKAHGKVVIEYDDKGLKSAQEDMGKLEEMAHKVISVFARLDSAISANGRNFGEYGTKMARTFALIAGGSAVLLGISQATGSFTGKLFQLRGGLAIIGALGTLLGGVPDTVKGFPHVIKQVILLSSAITLFAGSAGLLNKVFVQLGKFAGSTRIIQGLIRTFPQLSAQIGRLASFVPSIRQVGEGVDRIGSPIHKIARLALGIGALISTIRTGSKVAESLYKAMEKLNIAAAGIVVGVKAVAGFISALKELSGVLGLLPGAFAIFGIAAGTAALGLQGFKDALKNMDDAAKFEEALKKLAPEAANTARAIKDLKGEFDGMRKAVQNRLFEGLSGEVTALGRIYLPLMATMLGDVAGELNGIVLSLTSFAKTDKAILTINSLFASTVQFLSNVKSSIAPFVEGLLTIAAVGAQAFADLSNGMGNAAESFRDLINTAAADGSLRAWIDRGIQGVRDLVGFLVAVKQIFSTIFAAFGAEGGGVLSTLNAMAGAVRDFLRSAEGQEALKSLVDLLKLFAGESLMVVTEALRALGPALIALKPFVEELSKAFGASLVVVFRALAPLLEAFAETLSFLAPVIAPILGAFLALGVAGKVLALIFAPIVFGINLLVSAFAIFKGAITAIRIAWSLLSFVFAVSPFTIIILAVIALAALIYIYWDEISAFLVKAWEWIKSTAIKVWTAISDFFEDLWSDIVDTAKKVWQSILDFLSTIWDGIVWLFMNFSVPGLIMQYWDEILAFTQKAWNAIVTWLSDLWNSIVESTRFIWEPIVSIFTSIWNIIYDIFTTWLFLIWEVVKHFFTTIVDGAILIWETFVTWITELWARVVYGFHAIFDPIVEWWNAFWDKVTLYAQVAWQMFQTWLDARLQALSEFWHGIVDPLVEWWNGVWNSITTFVRDAWNTISNAVQTGLDRASQAFHAVFDPIRDWWNRLWDNINQTIDRGVNAIREWFGKIPGWITGALGDVWNLLTGAGKAIIEGFLSGLKGAFKKVEDFVGGITDWIKANKGPLPYDKRLLSPAGIAIMQGLLGGLESQRGKVISFMQGLTSSIANGINAAGADIASANLQLSTNSSVGVATAAASAVTSPAGASPAIPAPAISVPPGASAGGGNTYIEKVEVPINSKLDPTDPVAWKKTIKAITTGIRNEEREGS